MRLLKLHACMWLCICGPFGFMSCCYAASYTKSSDHWIVCTLLNTLYVKHHRDSNIISLFHTYFPGPIFTVVSGVMEQGVALLGLNRTGSPCSVGRPTAPAAGPATADRPRAGPPACRQRYRRRQTTTDSDSCIGLSWFRYRYRKTVYNSQVFYVDMMILDLSWSRRRHVSY